MQNKPMSATASHLVGFYGYKLKSSKIGDQPTISLFNDDNELVISDSNLIEPFENTLFICHGNEYEKTFIVSSIIM